jgi:hypothetical protein
MNPRRRPTKRGPPRVADPPATARGRQCSTLTATPTGGPASRFHLGWSHPTGFGYRLETGVSFVPIRARA